MLPASCSLVRTHATVRTLRPPTSPPVLQSGAEGMKGAVAKGTTKVKEQPKDVDKTAMLLRACAKVSMEVRVFD